MVEINSELIFGILKKIQDDVAYIRRRMDDHDEQLKSVRHTLKDRLFADQAV